MGVPVVAARRGALPEVARRRRAARRSRPGAGDAGSLAGADAADDRRSEVARGRGRARHRPGPIVPVDRCRRAPSAKPMIGRCTAGACAREPITPSTMRIGIDARELGGTADRRRSLSERPAGRVAGHARRLPRVRALRAPAARPAGRHDARVIPGSGGSWWEQVRLPCCHETGRPRRAFSPGLHHTARAPASRPSSRSTTCRSPCIRSGSARAKGSAVAG